MDVLIQMYAMERHYQQYTMIQLSHPKLALILHITSLS